MSRRHADTLADPSALLSPIDRLTAEWRAKRRRTDRFTVALLALWVVAMILLGVVAAA